MATRYLHWRMCCFGVLLISSVLGSPIPQESEVISVIPEDVGETLPDSTQTPLETTTKHFLQFLFEHEGVRNPWLAQLVKSTAPVLAQEGVGGVIRQSFKAAPALALGAFNGLANFRIGPLLNFPAVPTTTLIPPYKRYRNFAWQWQ